MAQNSYCGKSTAPEDAIAPTLTPCAKADCSKDSCWGSSSASKVVATPLLTQPVEANSCKHACYGGSLASKVSSAPILKPLVKDNRKNSCCGKSYASETVAASRLAPPTKDSCKDACCDGNNAKSFYSKASFEDKCQNSGKCTDDKSALEDAPDCCRDKVGPCCNSSCLDVLAMRECEMNAAQCTDSCCQEPASSGATDSKACDQHLRSAMDRYGATLQALGCICHALIALGQETCCDLRDSRLSGKRQKAKNMSALSRRSSGVSCRSSGAAASEKEFVKRRSKGKMTARPGLGDECCSAKVPKVYVKDGAHPSGSCRAADQEAVDNACAKKKSFRSCRSGGKPSACGAEALENDCKDDCRAQSLSSGRQGSCADNCGSPPPSVTGLAIDKKPIPALVDIEKQAAGSEHVVLGVSGMTCTGCETKLNRMLATVPAVKELKTSLVLSRAEFHVDLRLGSVEEVVKHLERTTEFKITRVQNQGSSLDLIVSDKVSDFINQEWPTGVLEIAPLDKQTVRVSFDPKVVGARELVEDIWRPAVKLAPPCSDPSLAAGKKHVRNVGVMTLLSAVLTIPVLVMAWAPLPPGETAYSSASFALATIVQVVIAGPFYPKALKALIFARVIEIDLLIVLSTSAAYIFSVVSFAYLIAGNPLSTREFFETSTLLVTLIMVGRWVTSLASQRAVESISIQSLQSSTAILLGKEGALEREIDARLLQYGDCFKILPDTRVPTDGNILTGSSEVDESMLTGESRPVEKHPKSAVIAGSINGPGTLVARLTRVPGDNTISTIAAMVDEAKLSKPKLQDLADKVASYFVPVVVVLTIITFVIWIAVGVTVRGYSGSDAAIRATTYAIAVLIVSCPCAIGLAVPMVIVIVSGVAADKGVVFKSADAIEAAHKASHVVLDKTGTLTQGKLSVIVEECLDNSSLPLLLGLVENSRHPVSVAVATHLRDARIQTSIVLEPKSLAGKGMETVFRGQRLRAGNSRWLDLSENETVQSTLAQGYTVFCFTVNGALMAVYGLEDELRPDAAATVETLQKRGVSVHVVSGDDDAAVYTLASRLNIPSDRVRSRSSPSAKTEYVRKLLGSGPVQKQPVVVFCGDGTNDAAAIAQATIGVHMNEGTDVAKSAADVVLMRPALAGILTMMNASRISTNRIMFNFAWSFVYNTFAILLAAGAFVDARIPPKFAGLGELVSVLPVIAAAALLRWSKI